jgi:hypothetical protein
LKRGSENTLFLFRKLSLGNVVYSAYGAYRSADFSIRFKECLRPRCQPSSTAALIRNPIVDVEDAVSRWILSLPDSFDNPLSVFRKYTGGKCLCSYAFIGGESKVRTQFR